MIVGLITTYASSVLHNTHEFETRSGDVHSRQHYVNKFVSDLWQIGGFLRVLIFSPPITLAATILLNVALNTIISQKTSM
jgi:hypothetical protein